MASHASAPSSPLKRDSQGNKGMTKASQARRKPSPKDPQENPPTHIPNSAAICRYMHGLSVPPLAGTPKFCAPNTPQWPRKSAKVYPWLMEIFCSSSPKGSDAVARSKPINGSPPGNRTAKRSVYAIHFGRFQSLRTWN
ncbi:hypothetical protein BCR34DRAFT_602377 [Clohesyomyces aquaticus]|uniref:Uncharacterized protein n=1 Tax=Clohesyomyces aquaticus TaxID=1231657 RepID=A0A1Y1ZJP6_9PLEO|nr:hypothetical protein BCR34DRAFT_602377 [Clohesyomyces aquaticus]